MAQPMSMDPTEAAPFCGAGNNHAHRGTGERMVGRYGPYEYCTALRVYRTAVAQVCCQRFSDIRGQWESFCTVAFTLCDDDLAGSPIDVVKLKLGDFTRPQTQTNKHGQDRKVTATASSGGVAGREKALHLVRGQSLRQSG
jgi:hypothetical protein